MRRLDVVLELPRFGFPIVVAAAQGKGGRVIKLNSPPRSTQSSLDDVQFLRSWETTDAPRLVLSEDIPGLLGRIVSRGLCSDKNDDTYLGLVVLLALCFVGALSLIGTDAGCTHLGGNDWRAMQYRGGRDSAVVVIGEYWRSRKSVGRREYETRGFCGNISDGSEELGE